MKTIKEKFAEIREQNPYWSDFICFSDIFRNRRRISWSRDEIVANFLELVSKDDLPAMNRRRVANEVADDVLKKLGQFSEYKKSGKFQKSFKSAYVKRFEGLDTGSEKQALKTAKNKQKKEA